MNMKGFQIKHLFSLLSLLLFAGYTTDALSYDYSATIECLKEPLKPQYKGGIIFNSEFNNGLRGWSSFGNGKIIHRKSNDGNDFIVAHSRNQPHDSFSQKLYLHKENLYTFSAWVQVSEGNVPVTAVFKTVDGFIHAGSVVAQSGCWSMFKGGLTVNSSGLSELYFESNNTNVEIWVDSVSLQPFTEEEWKSHQDQSIAKAHKRNVKIHAVNAKGEVLDGAKISIILNKASFPFGSAISKEILTNTAYQNWYLSRFSVTVFENEMKWYATEGSSQGNEDYSVADAMVKFAKEHGIAIRGHNILWDDEKYQPWWVKSLSPENLRAAAFKRVESVVSRYAGSVIGWDVINENLHFSFFENIIGANASLEFFQKAHQLDNRATMFLNDYNTIERSNDAKSSPAQYLRKLREIANCGTVGIGLEGHFSTPDLPYMRASLDTLAASGAPIWLTEVDVGDCPNQAAYLEQVLREARSHPAVQGILLWAGWHPNGCWRMCLTDGNFNNLPTGNVVDKLINEWRPKNIEGTTNSNGDFEVSLFHGDYDVMINHQSINSSFIRSFEVKGTKISEETTTLHLHTTI